MVCLQNAADADSIFHKLGRGIRISIKVLYWQRRQKKKMIYSVPSWVSVLAAIVFVLFSVFSYLVDQYYGGEVR